MECAKGQAKCACQVLDKQVGRGLSRKLEKRREEAVQGLTHSAKLGTCHPQWEHGAKGRGGYDNVYLRHWKHAERERKSGHLQY